MIEYIVEFKIENIWHPVTPPSTFSTLSKAQDRLERVSKFKDRTKLRIVEGSSNAHQP